MSDWAMATPPLMAMPLEERQLVELLEAGGGEVLGILGARLLLALLAVRRRHAGLLALELRLHCLVGLLGGGLADGAWRTP